MKSDNCDAIVELCKAQMYKIEHLFVGFKETLIMSCLQGYMGHAWADNENDPGSAQIITGDFCFFAGCPNVNLIKNIPEYYSSQYLLMLPQNEAWAALIEQYYKNNAVKFNRYAIKKETGVFDRNLLENYIKLLPKDYVLKQIDEDIYEQSKIEAWSKDLCSQFYTYKDYYKSGIGFAVLHDGRLVSGASSYTVYSGGIEIEIDTKPNYRRKGLAKVCASALILKCLERGLYPSWDAANKESVALAEKLGYHFDHEYTTYAVINQYFKPDVENFLEE